MTGRPARREALYGSRPAAGPVPAGPRREALHARGLEPLAGTGPAPSSHREALHAFRAGIGSSPTAGPSSPALERMTTQRDRLADELAAGRPVDVAGTIRAQLAEAYAEAAALEAAQLLEGAGTGRPRGLAGLLPGLEPPARLEPLAGLPPAAAQLLAHVTRARTADELADDARAALHARPQLPQDGPAAAAGTPAGPFTVPAALAGLIGADRPQVIADAAGRHALAGRAQLAARIRAQATAAARLELEHGPAGTHGPSTGPTVAQDGPDRPAAWIPGALDRGPALEVAGRPVHGLQLADGTAYRLEDGPAGPHWRALEPAAMPGTELEAWRAPTDRKRDPAPTPTNRRPSAPDAPGSSAPAGTRARSGLAPLGVPALAALVDASHWSEDVTAAALETLAGTPHEAPQELEHGTPGPTSPAQPLEAGTRAPGRPQLPGEALPAPHGPAQAGPRPHTCGRPDACRLEPPQEPPTMVTEHHAPGCPGPHPLGTLCHGYRPQDGPTLADVGHELARRHRAAQEAPQGRPQELAGLPVTLDERVPLGVVRLASFVELAGPQDGPQDVDERGPLERLADDVREAGTWTRNTVALAVSRAQLVDLGLVEPTPEERAELEASRAAWQAAQELEAAPARAWDAMRARQRARTEAGRLEAAQTAQHEHPEA